MPTRFMLCVALCASFISSTWALSSEDIDIKCAGLTRTVSTSVGFLKTTKLTANGLQMLEIPSAEFQLDIEYKGAQVSLVPSDFEVKSVGSAKDGREEQKVYELVSQKQGYPVRIYLHYCCDPKVVYQRKFVEIDPCRDLAGAILKRVVLENSRMKDVLVPVVPGALADVDTAPVEGQFAFKGNSPFGGIDMSKKRGFFFYLESNADSSFAVYSFRHDLFACEMTNTPLENGYTSGKFTFGTALGNADDLFKQYRNFLLEGPYSFFGATDQCRQFRKKYEGYFAACRYLPLVGDVNGVDAEARITNGKGFLILYNRTQKQKKTEVLLDNKWLDLSGELKLTDWSSFKPSTDMGTTQAGGKLDIELKPGEVKVIGVNIES